MKDSNFKIYLKNNVDSINKELESLFNIWRTEIDQLSPQLTLLLSLLQEGSKGGKRIRGALVMLGHSLASPKKLSSKDQKAILQIAVAYEIFQTAILAHDDVIDKSELRRGRPTIYQQLGNNHYGISQTICIGDLGFFITYKLIAESQFPDTVKTKATGFFSDALTKTILGEMLDVEFAHKKIDMHEDVFEEIVKVYKLKTAYYTFIAPLSLGAILAGADAKLLKNIKLFGENLGILFQINDDIADIFDNQTISNKDQGADIKEGKLTMLYVKALQSANNEQRRVLKKYYGKSRLDEKVIAEIQNVFIQTGALRYVEILAENFENKTRQIIPHIAKQKSVQQILNEIVDYVSRKEKISHG